MSVSELFLPRFDMFDKPKTEEIPCDDVMSVILLMQCNQCSTSFARITQIIKVRQTKPLKSLKRENRN